MKQGAEQIQIGDVRVGGICAAEEGEYLLGDKYSTCMLNIGRLCAQRMFVTMSSNITNMYLNDEH